MVITKLIRLEILISKRERAFYLPYDMKFKCLNENRNVASLEKQGFHLPLLVS